MTMILKASQRGGDAALAAHLLNAHDNDHIDIHCVNGFMSTNVTEAFAEMRAVASATRCKQYMFSLSLSPPKDAIVSNADFEDAIYKSLQRLGLTGQPHVVIFHEKNGRRHAHLVVSRINKQSLTAINLPYFKEKLCDLSRELFLHHEWELPQGHVDRALSDPLNYSLEEKQVADRAERDPQEIKAQLQECWQRSDSKAGFEHALREAGFIVCRGDRRGFVAIDHDGHVYSLSRWLGVKTKELKAKLGDPEHLQSVEDALTEYETKQSGLNAKFNENNDPTNADFNALLVEQIAALEAHKAERIKAHRQARAALRDSQKRERLEEILNFKKSNFTLRRLWKWATGKRDGLLKQRLEQLKAQADLFEAHKQKLGEKQRAEMRSIRAKLAELKCQKGEPQQSHFKEQSRDKFNVKADPDFAFHKSQIKAKPDYVLRLISQMRETFSCKDIAKELSRFIGEPTKLATSIQRVLRAKDLLVVDGGNAQSGDQSFTTQTYQDQHKQMMRNVNVLANRKGFQVRSNYIRGAIAAQDKALNKTVGASLSTEQRSAIRHVTASKSLSCIIGLAGAGKSTLLAAAKEAWEKQGYRVVGGALAGKAADGLHTASNIPSRTLHSWEYGWKHDQNQLGSSDVFVIDEAGMVGTAQLARIIAQVKDKNAKLVLVGDPEQLQPIEAGTPFRDIADAAGFAGLSEILRQKADWQKAASLDLARGRTAEAMQAYKDNGMVKATPSQHDAIDALIEDYMVNLELYGDEKSRLALAHRRLDVFNINIGIRAARKLAGDLRDGVSVNTEHGSREFATGDRIVFTKNDRTLGVKNGMLGTVRSVKGKRLTIELDQEIRAEKPKNIDITTDQYNTLDHGYAITIHKSQGATVDQSFVLRSRAMDKHLDYVAMTRHKERIHLYDHLIATLENNDRSL